MSDEKGGTPQAFNYQPAPPPVFSTDKQNEAFNNQAPPPSNAVQPMGTSTSTNYNNYNNYSNFQTSTYTQPGAIQTVPVIVQQPQEDYMVKAILVTLFCFWPTGLFAIIKASAARKAYAIGDIAEGQSNAESARKLIRITIIVGAIVIALIVISVIVRIVLQLAL